MSFNSKITKSLATLMTLGLFALLAAGSGPIYQDNTNYTRVDIKSGTIDSDIRIVAADGRFELKPGERFTPPFYSDLFLCTGLNYKNILESFSSARNCGAVDVKIYVGDNPEPLYGLLALNRAIVDAFGPAARSYLIKIPQDKINVAREGNTAVVFEYMTWKKSWHNDYGAQSATRKNYGWVLWMSSVPF
jgi:hypothetical protein